MKQLVGIILLFLSVACHAQPMSVEAYKDTLKRNYGIKPSVNYSLMSHPAFNWIVLADMIAAGGSGGGSGVSPELRDSLNQAFTDISQLQEDVTGLATGTGTLEQVLTNGNRTGDNTLILDTGNDTFMKAVNEYNDPVFQVDNNGIMYGQVDGTTRMRVQDETNYVEYDYTKRVYERNSSVLELGGRNDLGRGVIKVYDDYTVTFSEDGIAGRGELVVNGNTITGTSPGSTSPIELQGLSGLNLYTENGPYGVYDIRLGYKDVEAGDVVVMSINDLRVNITKPIITPNMTMDEENINIDEVVYMDVNSELRRIPVTKLDLPVRMYVLTADGDGTEVTFAQYLGENTYNSCVALPQVDSLPRIKRCYTSMGSPNFAFVVFETAPAAGTGNIVVNIVAGKN